MKMAEIDFSNLISQMVFLDYIVELIRYLINKLSDFLKHFIKV